MIILKYIQLCIISPQKAMFKTIPVISLIELAKNWTLNTILNP